jgi:signal transduction histidine kinase
MPISRRDLLVLLILVGAGVASVVVWDFGRIDIGMTLVADGDRVLVEDVTPDGNAHRNGWYPGLTLLDLTKVDGSPVERGEPIGLDPSAGAWYQEAVRAVELFGSSSSPLVVIDADRRPPIEAVPSAQIATAVAGDVDPDSGEVYLSATIERGYLDLLLRDSIWIAILGIVVGLLVWRFCAHGLAGEVGRENAIILGASAAAPAIALPAVQVGTPAGIAAGYLVPAAIALVLGLSLARLHPERQWVQTAMAGALVAAALVVLLVIRHLTSPALATDGRGTIVVLVAAVAVIPAVVAGLAPGSIGRGRAVLVSLALVPAAALILVGQDNPGLVLPIALVALLLGWQLLPLERVGALLGRGLGQVRSRASASVPDAEPTAVVGRDVLSYGLIAVAILVGLAAPIGGQSAGAWAVVIGAGLAALVGFSVRRGFLGAAWADAAAPLGAAVGVPVMLAAVSMGESNLPLSTVPTAFAALGVAHVLAQRHTDVAWGGRLIAGSAGLVGIIALLSFAGAPVAIPLLGLVALIPGIPVAFAEEPGEARAVSSRLETLAVALTPGAAATVLVPSIGPLLLGAWLVALVVWRRFTLTPLVGLAQRTQLQRDLAVAAAETERARLAADLHDDALQQLTMLVRTLDESGQTEAAWQAREVADKLRSVVGDLRLPILDDLGAGAALEWLVERVEPLAGGSVKLERSDEARPPANVELAVFRVAQEAMTNAIKHGKPPIAVRYDVRSDGRVTLAIDDAGDGIGSEAADEAPRHGHFGLINMQQRAEQIGALLDVRRWPAGGTRVALEWRPQ